MKLGAPTHGRVPQVLLLGPGKAHIQTRPDASKKEAGDLHIISLPGRIIAT
jgi:hypothetical protein